MTASATGPSRTIGSSWPTLGFGSEGTKSPADVLASRRAAIVAEPGMGKTQLLYHLGQLDPERLPLVLKLNELAAQLQPDDDLERVLAAGLARARAFAGGVRAPTRDALDGNAYTLLFDALDEVVSDRRAEVTALLVALADRYPQHVMVVTSRINDEVFALEAAGFRIFRIPRDSQWGRDYLEHRGIPEERIRQLFVDVQTVADLLAVPRYREPHRGAAGARTASGNPDDRVRTHDRGGCTRCRAAGG